MIELTHKGKKYQLSQNDIGQPYVRLPDGTFLAVEWDGKQVTVTEELTPAVAVRHAGNKVGKKSTRVY